jgi:hypothetical protein
MMLCQPCTHLRKFVAKAGRLDHGYVATPRHEMPHHLEQTAGPECHVERAITPVMEGLGRMKEKSPRFRSGVGREAPDDIDRILLKGAEGALGIPDQVQVLGSREGGIERRRSLDVGQDEVAKLAGRAPIVGHDEVAFAAIEEAIGTNQDVFGTGTGLRSISQTQLAAGENRPAQSLHQLGVHRMSRPGTQNEPLGFDQGFEIDLKACVVGRLHRHPKLGIEPPDLLCGRSQPVSFQQPRSKPQGREVFGVDRRIRRRNALWAAVHRRQPPAFDAAINDSFESG